MNLPLVSVIIPLYNSAKYIKETIESALNQKYSEIEVIIIDDGSTDRSAEIVKGLNDRRIIYIYQQNKGVSLARNKGILASRGKYIALLDHDDLWLPEKLEKQIPILDGNPEIGLVYSDSYKINPEGGILGKLFEEVKPCRGNVFPELFLGNFIPCLTAVVRKTVLDKVGVFNHHFSIAEEYDLFLRIARFFKVEYVDLPLAKYRVHSGNLSRNSSLLFREQFEILEKCLKRYPELKDILKGKLYPPPPSSPSRGEEIGRGNFEIPYNKIRRRFAKLHYSLGRTYQMQKEFSQSRKEFLKAIRLGPFNLKAEIFWLLSLLRIAVPERKIFLEKIWLTKTFY